MVVSIAEKNLIWAFSAGVNVSFAAGALREEDVGAVANVFVMLVDAGEVRSISHSRPP